jgi:hypothetical protein
MILAVIYTLLNIKTFNVNLNTSFRRCTTTRNGVLLKSQTSTIY